jgi:hypothetical protein
MVSLVVDRAHMTDRSVLVPGLPDGLREGAACRFSRTRVWIDPSLTVDLARAGRWSGEVEILRPPLSAPVLASTLRTSLPREGKGGGFLGLLDPGDTNPFATKARSILQAASGYDHLVGLGPGSTPSGDDFLTGMFLSTRIVTEGFRPLRPVLSPDALGRTTPGGRTLLSLALKDSYPDYLRRLAEDLCRKRDEDGVRDAVRRAASFGETSGTDAMVGLLWSLCGGKLDPPGRPIRLAPGTGR